MATWVIGVIVAYLRSISKYTVNLNSCSTIVIGRVAGFLRPKSTSSINNRQSKTFIIRNTIVVMMVGGEMDGLFRPTSKISINPHVEIDCLAVIASCTIVGTSLLSVLIQFSENVFGIFSSEWVFPALLVF